MNSLSNTDTAALSVGLEVGVYYFSHAYDEATAVQEAEWVINTLNSYGYTDYHCKLVFGMTMKNIANYVI